MKLEASGKLPDIFIHLLRMRQNAKVITFDAKYKLLPLTDVYEEYSDELIKDIMEEQKADIDEYRQTEEDLKLYSKFMMKKEKVPW